MLKLTIFAAALLTLSACERILVAGSETEAARCEEIGAALPTRSRADTAQTQAEIDRLYAVFEAVCPRQAELIPE